MTLYGRIECVHRTCLLCTLAHGPGLPFASHVVPIHKLCDMSESERLVWYGEPCSWMFSGHATYCLPLLCFPLFVPARTENSYRTTVSLFSHRTHSLYQMYCTEQIMNVLLWENVQAQLKWILCTWHLLSRVWCDLWQHTWISRHIIGFSTLWLLVFTLVLRWSSVHGCVKLKSLTLPARRSLFNLSTPP